VRAGGDIAAGGGWKPQPELALDPGVIRSRSADVALVRLEQREAVPTEIWDWFGDVGAGLRSLDGKRDALVCRSLSGIGGRLDRRPDDARGDLPAGDGLLWSTHGYRVQPSAARPPPSAGH
jgi:hypothetical protein